MINGRGGSGTSGSRFTDGTTQSQTGCFSADNFWAAEGPQPFMWGLDCFLGNVEIPEGVVMKLYTTHGRFDDMCSSGELLSTLHGPFNDLKSNVMYHNDGKVRACGVHIAVAPGYTCH